MNEREIFIAALQKASAAERRTYLDAACGGDEGLRRSVEELLEVHERAGSFLEHPLADPAVTTDDPISERPGTVIGPYKLMEQIGEGGMGLVFVAEQQQPVRRKIALKVIKPGMDTRQVVARFEAERQALALMDHPNIAKVHDGGTTDSGRPYFVMELVKGVPITDYCDHDQVSIRERLELFVSVCQAVQHAHQKGIIHRDLKPSNVLVMSHDGTPVVKVIDFGVAKAIGQRLTDKTIYTLFSHMVGTPLYMSPEQAGQSGLDVDTRSDIYSLGVLLYELLTGTTPFDRERLRGVGFDEMQRIIREEEPPKPSTRISTLGQAVTTISTQRQSEPKRLSQLFRGELDWIAMKALDKNRDRRYETASAFAADVQRYLVDEPVLACPPSAWYRFGKFIRRHRMGLALGACVLAMVLSLAGSAVWSVRQGAIRLAETERGVMAALVQAETLLEEGYKQTETPEHWQATVRLAQTALANAQQLLAAGTATHELIERLQQVREAVDAAVRDSQLVIELERLQMESTGPQQPGYVVQRARNAASYARALINYGINLGAPEETAARVRRSRIRKVLSAALDQWWFHMVQSDRGQWFEVITKGIAQAPLALKLRCQLAMSEDDIAELARLSNEPALRESALRKLREDLQRGPERAEEDKLEKILLIVEPDPYAFRTRWRAALRSRDKAALIRLTAEPEAQTLRAADVVRIINCFPRDGDGWWPAIEPLLRSAQERSPGDFWVNYQLGSLYGIHRKNSEVYLGYLRAALAVRSDSPIAHIKLGWALMDTGNLDEAIHHFQAAIRLDPNSISPHEFLARALTRNGRLDEAIEEYRAILCIIPKDVVLGHDAIFHIQQVAVAHNCLGDLLQQKGQLDEAIAEYREAIRLVEDGYPYHVSLGWVLYRKGRLDEAIAEYREALRLDAAAAEYREALRLTYGREPHKDYAGAHHKLAIALSAKGQLDEAVAEYREASRANPTSAVLHNELAWLLAACSDPKRRNYYPQAVESAKKAVQLAPDAGSLWDTLGVALYRSGTWKEAIAALDKSMQLRKGGDTFDWFFLAMAHQQLGEKEMARQWYDKAVQWMDKNQPNNEELRRLRCEATELLGVTK